MALDPRADLVARQYKKWQYPEPIEDLDAWMVNGWDWFDPSHFHRIFWPDRPYQPEMDVLIAGCGTNQAPTIAYTNPAARITAIDISQESLDHGHYLKEKHNLKNLELILLPIEEVSDLSRYFDLVISSGVLHHMASPQVGMNALAEVLRTDAVAAIMLYARYGRIGVEAMQAVFRDMGLQQDEASLNIVKAGLNWLHPTHPARVYMDVAPDLSYDAGMVDTFLHGRDVSFTVQDCLDLVEHSGLVFQDWYFKTPVYPPIVADPHSEFLAAINTLSDRKMWSIMERLRNQTGCHLFTACRPERPTRTYRIDFSSSDAFDYVPIWRKNSGLDGETAIRPGWTIYLEHDQRIFAAAIDGMRSIREIAEYLAQAGTIAGASEAELRQRGISFFEGLWRTDFLAVELPCCL